MPRLPRIPVQSVGVKPRPTASTGEPIAVFKTLFLDEI